ncbi:MAG: glycosyl hydrolase, partial [Bryobacteraceae bacterium]
MRAKGIKGAIIYDTGPGTALPASSRMVLGRKGYHVIKTNEFAGAYISSLPFPKIKAWGLESNELLCFAAKEAHRLGVKLVISIGLADTSGDIPAKYGVQRLVWSEISVTGPAIFEGRLPEPLDAVAGSRTDLKTWTPTNGPPVPGRFTPTPIAVLAIPDKPNFTAADVVDLPAPLNGPGVVKWQVPRGRWKILRFAYEPTGKTNAWGYFTDGMSAEALDATWKVTIGRLFAEMSPDERKALYGVEDDSWEAGEGTWTRLFPSEFRRLRGYNLIPWLPVLAGEPMGTKAEREGVERDYYRTIADLIAKNHYAHLTELAHRNGLVSYAEGTGPDSAQIDPMKDSGSVDVPMAEFWVPSTHRPTPDSRFLARDAASGSHIYGKKMMACESFTSIGPEWEMSLFDL